MSCRCNCGYVCKRKCGLPISECINLHYKKDCEHKWNGEEFIFANGCGSSVTCSICGTVAIDHDMKVGP